MPDFRYTPDEDIQVHEEGAIRLICGPFQSHENGLPEWLKNSADACAREDAPEDRRVIVVIFNYGGGHRPSISCLDFSGMTSTMVEENFRVWADPEAARRGLFSDRVQGGHGSGGKCYMVQMFDGHAVLHTVKNEHGNRYGVAAHSLKFGYIPDKPQGRDFPVPDRGEELDRVLAPLRCSLEELPPEARTACAQADGFTLVTGVLPKGYGKKIPYRHLIGSLQDHPQMIRTLGLCKVFVVVNGGKRTHHTIHLGLPDIEPMAGAPEPRVVQIPEKLRDPASGLEVSTTQEGKYPAGQLELKSSRVSMRWKWKMRHTILFVARSGFIGFVPVPELEVPSHFRDHIYGRCTLEALEPFKQSDRRRLADADLTRALIAFIGEQVQAYAEDFETQERRRLDQQETGALSRMSQALDHWKDGFLHTFVQERWGLDLVRAEPAAPLPTGKPGRIDLALTFPRAGVGVAFKPRIKFFTAEGERIRSQPYVLMSDNQAVAAVDEDLMLVKSLQPGKTTLRAATFDQKVTSADLPLEVVQIREITVKPHRLSLEVGGRQQLKATCMLANGDHTSDVYLDWREEHPEIAKVSSSGLVFGLNPGRTGVVAADSTCSSKPVRLRVKPRRAPARPRTSPTVLISGEVDPDPDTGEYVYFSSEDAPVMQRPVDMERYIWWINGAAPFARLYLDPKEDYGYESREWRIYLVERFVDILAQIIMTNIIEERESLSAEEWMLTRGSLAAEIQATAARDLHDFIHEGKLPRLRV